MDKNKFTDLINNLKKLNKPFLIAHRGLSSMAPDNSIEAIRLACAKKYCDGVEFDIQETSDHHLIVRHNRSIVIEGKRAWIKDVPFAKLRLYESKSSVPQFEDLLEILKGNNKLIDIEIKTPGVAKKIINICRENKIYDRVIFSSLYFDIHKEIESIDKNAARILGYPKDRGKDLAQQKYLLPVVNLVIKYMRLRLKTKIKVMMKQSNTNLISLYHKVISKEVVDRIHKNNGLCIGVTISLHGDMDAKESEKVMMQMLEDGVDAIKTDYPQLRPKKVSD